MGVQEARWGRGGVTSKLQKKLIKNEKREGAEGGEGRLERTEAAVGGRRGEKKGGGRKTGEKVWKEGGSVLLKTGGQTVCNWLGPRGLKKRFKERRVEGDRGQINR